MANEKRQIPIEQEDRDFGPPYENCCFCRNPTRYWTKLKERSEGEQVACCISCATVFSVKEIPTKKEWCDREKQAERSFSDNSKPVLPAPKNAFH